jgi:hypothetical protein
MHFGCSYSNAVSITARVWSSVRSSCSVWCGSAGAIKCRRIFTEAYIVLFSLLCYSVHCLCVNLYWTTATGISGHFPTTLSEVFPCFFLSFKANARVLIRKDGARSTLPNFFSFLLFYCYVCSVLCILCTVCV